MLYLKCLAVLTFVGLAKSITVRWGEETQNGHWGTKHRISFSFTVGGKHYFFGLTDLTGGKYWFIQELKEDGKTGAETSTGTWYNYYTTVFPFAINDKQFIYGIDEQKHWFIKEILPGGIMGQETDNGYLSSKPTIIFPFDIGGKHYVYSLSGTNWFIKELLPNGKLGSKTDHGSWQFYYTIGFPFNINGRTYFYCVSDTYWFIQELLPGGKMGVETHNGHWTTNHKLSVPFSIDGKHYFYGLTDISDSSSFWFIQELLPGGKMGTEKTHGSWQFYYPLSFAFNINGRQFFYGLSEYYWFIQEIIQEPRLPIIPASGQGYCTQNRQAFRRKRQYINNNSCYRRCGGLNIVEERVTEIEHDEDNYLTVSFENPNFPVTSLSTFRVFADANHDNYIDLTAAMRAEIHYSHMPPVRDSISQDVYDYLQEMDRDVSDEAGHLLASSLGGAGATYNFAPQSPMLNRAVDVAGSVVPQPGWYDVEEMLREYLIEVNGSGYIRWSLVVEYSLLPNSRRPTAFALSIRFYDDHDRLVNWRGEGAVRSYRFLNVPRVACTNRNHPWWNH